MNHQLLTMTINRNNYEEYFLLYIDNELSVTDKDMVDVFIAANPDLAEELVMLQQSIIKPEELVFPGKENLVKALAIDENTEEKLLLLLDNELPENEKKEILALASNNESVKKEWELLQQVKLSAADKIVFEDKPLLYRKETRVIPFAWWRVAAAAMLIGFGLWGAVSYLNKNTKNTGGETVNVPATKNQPAVIAPQTQAPVIADTKNTETAANKNIENTTAQSPVTVQATPGKSSIQTTAPVNNNMVAANEEENKKDITPINENNFNNEDSNKKMIVSVSPETNSIKPDNNVEIPSSLKNEYAVNTSFNNDAGTQNFDTFEEEEDKPKKTKLGGFFKRVKRVIERKTKIKTGNDDEVKIANMSFAMN